MKNSETSEGNMIFVEYYYSKPGSIQLQVALSSTFVVTNRCKKKTFQYGVLAAQKDGQVKKILHCFIS